MERKFEKEGLSENFGEKEVRKLKDKYIDLSSYSPEMNEMRNMIEDFKKWALNYGIKSIF